MEGVLVMRHVPASRHHQFASFLPAGLPVWGHVTDHMTSSGPGRRHAVVVLVVSSPSHVRRWGVGEGDRVEVRGVAKSLLLENVRDFLFASRKLRFVAGGIVAGGLRGDVTLGPSRYVAVVGYRAPRAHSKWSPPVTS